MATYKALRLHCWQQRAWIGSGIVPPRANVWLCRLATYRALRLHCWQQGAGIGSGMVPPRANVWLCRLANYRVLRLQCWQQGAGIGSGMVPPRANVWLCGCTLATLRALRLAEDTKQFTEDSDSNTGSKMPISEGSSCSTSQTAQKCTSGILALESCCCQHFNLKTMKTINDQCGYSNNKPSP